MKVPHSRWFGLSILGYALLFLNCLGLLANDSLDSFTKIISGCLAIPGLLLIGFYGFLGFGSLEDALHKCAELEEQNDAMRQHIASKSFSGN